MKIDSQRVRRFWDAQAEKARNLPLESVANLEEDETLLNEKVITEIAKVFPLINLPVGGRVLDLGAGAGQWSFRFSELAEQVVAVEFSQGMLDLAQTEGSRLGIDNVDYVCCSAQEFDVDGSFDLIFLSGLLIYLNDTDCETLARNCLKLAKPGSQLILRDGTGINERFEILNKFSSELNAHYSAIYRTCEQYIDLFERNGFECIGHSDMFEDGSPLNKRLETRLRIYSFKKLQHGSV